MASIGSLTASLSFDSRNFTAGIAKAKTDSKRLASNLKQTGAQGKKSSRVLSAGFTKSANQIRNTRIHVLALTASLGLLGRAVTRAGREYSKAFGEIQAITGAAGQQLALIEKATKRYASTTTKSASEVLLLTKTIASLRPELLSDAAALDKITGSVITLSEAAGITGVEAAEALGNTLNQFGLDATEADKVINSLAAASQLSAKEIPFLTQALKEAGPVAKALNIPFDTTVAILEGLGKSGLDASKAGTGFRNFFSILQNEGIGNFDVQAQGAIGAIEGLIASNLNFSESSDLFGREVVVASEAIQQQIGHIKELIPAIQGTNTAYEQAAINANTFDGKMKTLGNRINLSAIALSEAFEPAITAAGEALAGFFTAVAEKGPDAVDALVASVIKLGNVADGVFKKLGETTRAAFGGFGSTIVGSGASVLGSAAGALGLQEVSDDLFAFSGDVARNPNKRPTQDQFKARLGQISLDTQAKNRAVDDIFAQKAIDRALGIEGAGAAAQASSFVSRESALASKRATQTTGTIDEGFAGFGQQVNIREQGKIFRGGTTRTSADTDRIVQEMRLMREAFLRGENTIELKVEVDENNIVRLITKNPAFQKAFDKRLEDSTRQIAR